MTVKQISVFLENKPGKLAELAKVLSDNAIDLRALSIAEASDFGIVRFIPRDAYGAATVLKDNNYICSTTDVLCVKVEDRPGSMADLIAILGKNGINIEYIYNTTSNEKDRAFMIIRPNDVAIAKGVLDKAGFGLAAIEELL